MKVKDTIDGLHIFQKWRRSSMPYERLGMDSKDIGIILDNAIRHLRAYNKHLDGK